MTSYPITLPQLREWLEHCTPDADIGMRTGAPTLCPLATAVHAVDPIQYWNVRVGSGYLSTGEHQSWMHPQWALLFVRRVDGRMKAGEIITARQALTLLR